MKRRIVLFLFASFFLVPHSVSAQETKEDNSADSKVQLPEIVVKAKFEEPDFVGPLFTETNTKTKMTEKGINALGPATKMSPQKTISLMPSVNQQSTDPIGLADISNYHESFRFRGVEPTGGGNPGSPVNVEEVPLTGRPGGGVNVYDMENFSNVSVYKGGVPADKGFGLTTIAGKIDMQIKKPAEQFGANLKQTIGSNSLTRTFLRLDSGILPSETAAFLSYSHTDMDKWKGDGDSGRDNSMFGVSQQVGDKLKVNAYGLYNNADVYTYRKLNYTQASSLGKYHDFDFSNKSSDYFYYGYNKAKFEDYSLMADVEYQVTDHSTITAKPFYWQDEGYYMETITTSTGDNKIRKWNIDHDMKGVLTQYAMDYNELNVEMGYFYLEQERPGPPTSWKLYNVTSDGLSFDKWQILSNSSKNQQSLPFVAGKYDFGALTLESGVKYLYYVMPSITSYNTTGIGDVSYEAALSKATKVEENASADEKHFTEVLPNLGMSYTLTDTLSSYFSYGRNYGVNLQLYPYFISQKSAFYKKGITLQDLWDTQKLELVDNYDIGMRYITEYLYIVPTLYYAKHKNKLAVYYDDALGVSYPSTSAEAEAYGAELEVGALPMKDLSIYGSVSYNRFYFSQDLSDSSGNTIAVKNKQVPDAPVFQAKGIVSYTIGRFTLSPIVKYFSDRYGDVEHDEQIDDAVVCDFNLTYSLPLPEMHIKKVDFSLAFNNIFDKDYVSIINASDYATLGSTYLVGAPRSVFATVSFAL